MFIKTLSVSNFRNYSSLNLLFVPGVNVFYGENGTGKTNIIEAVYWVSMMRSFRTAEDTVLVMHSQEAASVSLEVSDNMLEKVFSMEYDKLSRRKRVQENNTKIARLSSMIGKIPVVLFSPENILVVKGEPFLRRRFIDDMLSQTDAEYYNSLLKYMKCVSHRNYLLRKIREGAAKRDSLSVWNIQLSEHGKNILMRRKSAVSLLNSVLKEHLSGKGSEVVLEYNSRQFNDFSPEGVKKTYKEFFEKNIEEELVRAVTLIGPHRDDINIFYNGVPAKQFASEGQQRVTAILIKLAEGIFIKDRRGTYPVVLLDDFSSELDDSNRSFIGDTFRLFKQILITTTHRDNLKSFTADKEFHVEHGKVHS